MRNLMSRGLMFAVAATALGLGHAAFAQQQNEEEFDPSVEFEKWREAHRSPSALQEGQPYETQPSMREGLRPRPRGAGVDGSGGRGPRASQEADYRGYIAPYHERADQSGGASGADPLLPDSVKAWMGESNHQLQSGGYAPALAGYESLLGISPMITEVEARRNEWYSTTIAGQESERRRIQNEMRARASRLPSSDRFGPGNNFASGDNGADAPGGGSFGDRGMRSPGLAGSQFAGPSTRGSMGPASAYQGQPSAGMMGPAMAMHGMTGPGMVGQGFGATRRNLPSTGLHGGYQQSSTSGSSTSAPAFMPGPTIPGMIGPNNQAAVGAQGLGAARGAAGRAGGAGTGGQRAGGGRGR